MATRQLIITGSILSKIGRLTTDTELESVVTFLESLLDDPKQGARVYFRTEKPTAYAVNCEHLLLVYVYNDERLMITAVGLGNDYLND